MPEMNEHSLFTYRSLPEIKSILFPSSGYSTPGGGDCKYTKYIELNDSKHLKIHQLISDSNQELHTMYNLLRQQAQHCPISKKLFSVQATQTRLESQAKKKTYDQPINVTNPCATAVR